MKLLDLSLLLYAVDSSSIRHDRARPWLEELLSGRETVALPWVVLLGFLRLSTRAAVFSAALAPGEALDVVDGWLAQPLVSVVHPGRRHAQVLGGLLQHVGTAGNLVTDAHLAALAIEYGAELCSSDADLSRSRGVRWTDPLR